MKRILFPAVLLALSGAMGSAGTITYTCDPTINATESGLCNYLNTTIAGTYSSTFTNATADIYIEFGSTGLGESTQAYNFVTYNQYKTFLNNNKSDAIQRSAVTSLSNDTSAYGSGNVWVTAALETAMGISSADINGVESNGTTSCTGLTTVSANNSDPSAGCYNAVLTITNSPIMYYDYLGGTEPSGDYDFLATVEHETDEILGTASCIGTTTGTLVDGCGGSTPSAVDLFRYNGLNSLALNSAYTGLASATAGAYFSYNGGATNGANGKVYNTSANGQDYADFVSSSPCQTAISVQDAVGCPGEDAGLSILDDGSAEINILNAVGYDLAAPEPGTMGLFGVAFAMFLGYKNRLRA